MDAVGSETTVTARMTVANAKPPAVHALRTRVGVAPAAIERSDNQPASGGGAATTRYASEPTVAMLSIENCRSRTR